RGQVFLHWIVQFHLAAIDHFLQQEAGEWLCNGSNVEQRIAVDFLVGAVIQFSAAHNSAALLVHNADYDTDIPLFNLDALLQKSANGIGEILSRSAKR